MTYLTTDIMHVCDLAGIEWSTVLERAEQLFESEEITSSTERTE